MTKSLQGSSDQSPLDLPVVIGIPYDRSDKIICDGAGAKYHV
jgi:hypothetical protein